MNDDMVQILQLQFGECDNGSEPIISVKSVNSLTTRQFSKICRTCLSEGDNKPFFEITYEEKSVLDILKLHATIQVCQDDILPKNMCTSCLSDLFQMYAFIQKCQRSDAMLRYVVDLDSKIDLKDEPAVVTKAEENCEQMELKALEELVNQPSDDHDINSNDSLDEDDGDYVVKTQPKRKTTKNGRKRRKNIQTRHPSKMQGPPFKCRDCDEIYHKYELLRAHRKQAKHPEARNHACSICSKTFTSSKLRQHMRAHTKEKPYKCKICLQGFSMSGNLKRHMMTHTGERPHVCEICGKGFIQATTLQNHRKTHAKNEKISGDANSPHFICNYCGRGFKRLARYNAHLKKHFSESNDLKRSSQDDEPREHVCMTCKRAYKTKHLLKAHQLTHGEKTFLCSECGKGFVTKAALQSHLKVHTGEKPHTCNVCKKSFAHVGSFEAHILIHTGQKPYNCNICAKAFTQLSHLKYHLRTHSGERPYVCSYCGKSFALKGNLTVHVRTHTGETPYICPICGKGFYDSSSMKKHKRGHGDNSMPPTLHTMGVNVVASVNSKREHEDNSMPPTLHTMGVNVVASVNSVDVINSINSILT